MENSEYYVISDEESVSICAPPYSPVVSDVSVHANSDEDLNKIHEQFHQIPIMLYLKHPLLKLNSQLCQLGQALSSSLIMLTKTFVQLFKELIVKRSQLHYCYTIAIKDRIDLSEYSEVSCDNLVNFSDFLPNAQELELIKRDLQILVYRLACVICITNPSLCTFRRVIVQYIAT